MASRQIYIAGIGMTPFGDHSGSSVGRLARWAIDDALADAHCDRTQIEAVWFANTGQGALEGQHMIRGQVALRPMGFEGIPVINVENACASASTALHGAMNFLLAGGADIVLAVGAEKMSHPDRSRSFGLFEAGWDVADPEGNLRTLTELGGIDPATLPAPAETRSVFMDVYAAFARQHMRLFGSTERQFAAVSAKNHIHSVHNPRAQYRRPYTIDQVLAARSIVWPLTLPMCSPISDGAAAVVLCTTRGLARLAARRRAIRLRACVMGTSVNRDPDDLSRHLSRLTGTRAYEAAGIAPSEVSVAEVHDATAVGEVIQVECLGLCEPGEGGVVALRGDTTLGGRIPVNPSGGLESKGHPIGATGLGQIFELVQQLRGDAGERQVENARVGIAENGGGLWGVEEATCVVSLLSR